MKHGATPPPNEIADLVSVIIPAYNRVSLLGRAISSVLRQSHVNLELLVIDDGSKEDVKSVLESYHDRRLSYHRREENLGISAARNRGIELSKGGYIAFLDSDDEWKEGKLESQLARLSLMGEGYGACYTMHEKIDDRLGQKVESIEYCREGEVLDDLLLRTRFGISSLMVERAQLEELKGFDTRMNWGEDWDFLIRLAARTKFACVAEPMMVYHLHDQGRVSDRIEGNPGTADAYAMIYEKNRALFRRDRKAWGNILTLIGYFKASCGDYQGARKAFLESAVHDPLQRAAYLSLLRLLKGWKGRSEAP